MEWIKVSDRLPENRTIVLVCVIEQKYFGIWRGIISAYFDYEKGWIFPFMPQERITVKCWSICPEFPEYLKNEEGKCVKHIDVLNLQISESVYQNFLSRSMPATEQEYKDYLTQTTKP